MSKSDFEYAVNYDESCITISSSHHYSFEEYKVFMEQLKAYFDLSLYKLEVNESVVR